jgi:hypothetical protein
MSMVAPPAPPDQQYVSQFATDIVGINIQRAGVPFDPDSNSVTVSLIDATNTTLWTRAATRQGVGVYTYQFTSTDTSTPGVYRLVWGYSISGTPDPYTVFLQVGSASPAYDSLSADFKAIVESVWERFADLHDSPNGGPNLLIYYQTHMDRGRLAGLLKVAIGQLNTRAQPFMSFTTDTTAPFPFLQWGALLEQALYIEVIKHLMRSYTEEPALEGGTVARQDRRDYQQRWAMMLEVEAPVLKEMFDHFKISMMGLSRPRVLVSGGAFGNYGPTRLVGSAAARPHFWTRYY